MGFANLKSGFQEKWLPEVRHHCPGVPCLIVGTQVDLRDDAAVIEKLAKQRQAPISYKQGEGLAKDLSAVKYVTPTPANKYAISYMSQLGFSVVLF